MNIAVNQGADEGKKFIEYVNYLAEQGNYSTKWSTMGRPYYRKKGNEATA